MDQSLSNDAVILMSGKIWMGISGQMTVAALWFLLSATLLLPSSSHVEPPYQERGEESKERELALMHINIFHISMVIKQ